METHNCPGHPGPPGLTGAACRLAAGAAPEANHRHQTQHLVPPVTAANFLRGVNFMARAKPTTKTTTNPKSKHTAKLPTLTEQLLAAIADSGLSVNRLSKDSGVEQSSLQRFVTGERDMRLSNANKLAACLGLHLAKRDKAV